MDNKPLQNKKPLQIYFTQQELKELESKRKEYGFRSWAETIRNLIMTK